MPARRLADADVAHLLGERGADEAGVSDHDRAIGAYLRGEARAPSSVSPSMLDEMAILAIGGGHLEALRRLLDAGARVDGDPDSDEIPLGQACWRRRVEMTRELVNRGAALAFRGGGSAVGAALYGSRHCHHPEGGPTMQTSEEIPKEPYAEIVRLLLAAGAKIPEQVEGSGPRPMTLLAELGIEPLDAGQ